MELIVGSKVILLRPVLGEPTGSPGYVFDTYDDFDGLGNGAQVIFKGGSLDGFSAIDQEFCFKFVEHDPRYSSYEFKNVNQVTKDFRAGYWEF
jgi:hypothetical protein